MHLKTVAAVVAFTASTAALAQLGRTEKLVVTGDPAPDGNGQFDGAALWGPVLNSAGQTAFYASLTGTSGGSGVDDFGVFRSQGYSITQIARRGQGAPDGNGVFSGFASPWPDIDDSGQLVWQSTLSGTAGGSGAPDTQGIFRGSGAAVTQLARGGQPAPDGNGYLLTLGLPATNNAGAVVFGATLGGTAISGLDDRAIYRAQGVLTKIVRSWESAPDGNGIFYQLGEPTLNASGQVAFTAQLLGTVGVEADDYGLYRGDGTTLTQIAREGQAPPDGNGTFGNFIQPPWICDNGQVGFQVYIAGAPGDTYFGLYRGDGSTTTKIVRNGDPSPDGNGDIEYFMPNPSMNNVGQAAWWAFLRNTAGGTTDDQAIFRGSNTSDAIKIARRGDPAPGGDGTIGSFGDLVLNDTGVVAFESSLLGTSTNEVIYAGDGIDLVQVAREGQSLEGSTINYMSLPVYHDTRSSINGNGQVAYWAALADGRYGHFLFTPTLHWRGPSTGSWDTAANWTLGLVPADVHDIVIDPAGTTTVLGPSSPVAPNSLTVGGGAGVATLQLQPGGTLTPATWYVLVEDTGVLTGEGTLNADLYNYGVVSTTNATVTAYFINNGEVRLGDLSHRITALQLMNRGVIQGSGRIFAQYYGDMFGRLTVGSGEHLIITGAGHTNDGQIEVLGGELEFIGDFTNTRVFAPGLITGHDAVLRFHGGLTNHASVALSFGASDIFGDITNTAPGKIILSGGSNVTFYDDVVNQGELRTSAGSTAVFFGSVSGSGTFTGTGVNYFEGDLRPGSSPALVTFGGDVVLGSGALLAIDIGGITRGTSYDAINVAGDLSLDGTLSVALFGGFSPAVGNSFDIMDFGSLTGTFDRLLLPVLGTDRKWDRSQLYTQGMLSVTTLLLADVNLDGMVNALDISPFVQRLIHWSYQDEADCNQDGAVNALDISPFVAYLIRGAVRVVPEPTTLILLSIGAAASVRRRRQARRFGPAGVL